METTFRKYLNSKRIEKRITLRRFAELVGVVPGYISDIENGNKNAPESAVLAEMVRVLGLNKDEAYEFYDLAAKARDGIAQDLPNIIKENEVVVRALRTAKDTGASVAEWEAFIQAMEAKHNEGK